MKITIDRSLVEQALAALDCPGKAKTADEQAAITALRAALAEPVQEPDPGEYHGWVLREVLFEKGEPVGHREPVQEPVTWGVDWGRYGDQSCVSIIKKHADGTAEVVAVEYSPPQRKPLTEEEIEDAVREAEEPVAWRTFDGEGGWDYRDYENNEDYIYQYVKRNGGRYAHWVEPLYNRVQKS